MKYLYAVSVSRVFLVIIIINNIVSLSIIDKGILPLVKNSVGIQFYIDVENENRLNVCKVHTTNQNCCLEGAEKDECRLVDVYSKHYEIIKPRDRRTLLYVAPLIFQHDLKGHCDFNIGYQCYKNTDTFKVTIPFDTRINKHSKKLLQNYIQSEKISVCETIDQDSLNDCLPVSCDLKYLGHKLYYDSSKHCVDVPTCIGDLDKELPDIVYIPDANSCRNLEIPMTIEDIYAITSGLGVVTQTSTTKDDDYLEIKSNCSTISQNINLIRDIMYGRLCPYDNGKDIDLSVCCKSAVHKIILCIISIVCVLFLCICFITTSVCLYHKWSEGNIEEFWKRFKSRFNRKQKCRERTKTDREIRNALLKDVIVKDIPIELRDSVVNICNRIGKEVDGRRRYRGRDIGSQISLMEDQDSVCSTTVSDSDK